MQSSLRIARVDVSGYRLLSDDFAGLEALHRELQAVIRRYLPGVTASVLALPVPGADGKTVDWYSDLAGQPVALSALPAARRTAVKTRLEDRLVSLRRLADELPVRVRGSESLAQALRSATLFPDDSHVYVIEDEPVLTLWGFVLVKDRRRSGALVATAKAGTDHRRPVWPWGLAAILALALGGGGWYWSDRQQEASLESELGQALAAECAEPDRLTALQARLNRLDPGYSRYAELRRRIAGEQGRCAVAAALAREVSGAGWDCARLAAMRQGMSGQDLRRPPLAGISARLDERIGLCTRAAEASARLKQRLGDCAALAELGRGLGTLPADAEPLTQVRAPLDRELALCRAADELGAGITANPGNCEALYKLDRQLGAFDSSRPPLAPLRVRLNAELAHCAKAATLRQAMVDAQMDCVKLRALDRQMAGEDASREPLQSIRRGFDEVLGKCQAVEKEK